MSEYRIIEGDCLDTLSTLDAESVQTCVTSPPYWGLRDYGTEAQLGLEPTPEQYVANLVAVFREVKRVLRDDGTLWLNLGDSYAAQSGPNTSRKNTGQQAVLDSGGYELVSQAPPPGLKPKDLVGIPWMVAFALRADGWYLRSDIIWAKPNPMPESVTDRPTKAHEYLFLLTKSPRYFYDADAIREPGRTEGYDGGDYAPPGQTPNTGNRKTDKQRGHGRRHARFNDRWDAMSRQEQCALGRNKRSVWTVATQPFPGAHFATFPPKLIEPCVLAGSPPKCCEECGAPWNRVILDQEPPPEVERGSERVVPGDGGRSTRKIGQAYQDWLDAHPPVMVGWEPRCACEDAERLAAFPVVLDPFAGSGTTGLVALRHNRDFIGCELNPDYVQMARERLYSDGPLLNVEAVA